jgi:hypothetical protein
VIALEAVSVAMVVFEINGVERKKVDLYML